MSFSCEGDKVIPVEGISLNRTEIRVIRVPRERSLVATVTPIFATHQMITWTTNNPAVATVNNYGLVTIHDFGTATITATVEGGKSASANFTVAEAIYPEPPSADSNSPNFIETYFVDPNLGLEPVEDFNEIRGSKEGPISGAFTSLDGHFVITLMSPRLDSFRMAYADVVPEFRDFRFVKSSITTSTSTLDWRSMAFRITYKDPILNVWNFVTADEDVPALVPMIGPDDNEDFDARFSLLRRVDRTDNTGSAWGARTPHSSGIAGLTGDLGTAVRGIFNPGTTTSDPVINNESLVGTLLLPSGWTVFNGDEDGTIFWFRSKANPKDWFKVERAEAPAP
jgi:hypothetical protein